MQDIERIGDRYCSPRCGRGCTWDEYTAACDAGQTLATVMQEKTGLPWESRVWDNLGWHYETVLMIEKGGRGRLLGDAKVTISESLIGVEFVYTCFFNGPHQHVTKDNDPELAFLKAQREALEFAAACGEFARKTLCVK